MRRYLTVAALLLALAPASAQDLDFALMEPFPMGRTAGQIQWIVNNCGGRVTAAAVRHYERANARDTVRFLEGVQAGIQDWETKKRMMADVTPLCALARTMFGRGGWMPGLWDN